MRVPAAHVYRFLTLPRGNSTVCQLVCCYDEVDKFWAIASSTEGSYGMKVQRDGMRFIILIATVALGLAVGLGGGPREQAVSAVVGIVPAKDALASAVDLPSSVKLEQWQPVGVNSPQWITGALNVGKSDYSEGDVVPFQLTIPANVAAGTYDFRLCRDYHLGSQFGYLFLDDFDTDRAAVPGGAISNSNSPFDAVNATVDSFNETNLQGNCNNAEEAETTVTITTKTVDPNSPTFVLWGGHLAEPGDPGVGAGCRSEARWPRGARPRFRPLPVS